MLLLTFKVWGQNDCFTVVDSASNTPIPYCNIIYNGNQGMVTNHLGQFCIAKLKSDTIRVSNISYYTTTVLAQTNSLIYLTPKHFAIKEVDINWSKYKFYWMGNTLKKHDSYINLWRFCQIGLHIKALKKGTGILEKVVVPIKNTNNMKVPFRLHVYAVNSSGEVGKELLPENVYGQLHDKDFERMELDILKYQIEIPKNGVFVAIELLSNNKPEELQIGTGVRYFEKNNNRIAVSQARYRHRKLKKLSSWKPESFYIEAYPFTNIEGMYGELPLIKVKIRQIKTGI